MKKQAKEFLYLDQDSYNYNLDQEKKIFDLFNEIKAQVISTLGEYEINYLDLIDSPVTYLVGNYWIEFANRPKHIEANKEIICVSDTHLNIPLLKKNVTTFKRALADMGKYAPALNKKGLKSKLNKDDFKKYLDPKKAKHFKAVQKLYEASQEIKEFSPQVVEINILRYCEGFVMNSFNLEINYGLFQI